MAIQYGLYVYVKIIGFKANLNIDELLSAPLTRKLTLVNGAEPDSLYK